MNKEERFVVILVVSVILVIVLAVNGSNLIKDVSKINACRTIDDERQRALCLGADAEVDDFD